MLTFTTKPMKHQQTAIDKLQRVKVGALYMDMGTGKTRTGLGLGVPRILEGKVDCILWLCPVSVKQAIADEVKKHLPNAIYEMVDPAGIKDWNAHIYIAGIESLSSSFNLNFSLLELVEKKRCFIVADESLLIKNHIAKRTRALWRLGERAEYKLILTGIPVANNEQDLYSQWYFLDPRILGYTSFYSFAANHLEYDPRIEGRVVRAHNTEYLVNKMAPFLYQVRKDECLDLPPKSYSTRYCKMTESQYWEYENGKEHIIRIMEQWDDWDSYTSTLIFRLFDIVQKVVSGKTKYWKDIFETPLENPRIQLLLETMNEIPEDSKVIIWVKYTHEIEMISDVLANEGYNVAKLYGKLSVKQRNKNLDKFKNEAEILVANKGCGAYGLNLQHANYAIYYSNDFSWYTRSQSEDRIHRTGQEKNVHIIDFICEHTIDERIYRSMISKENLVDTLRREMNEQKDKADTLRRWLDGKKIS